MKTNNTFKSSIGKLFRFLAPYSKLLLVAIISVLISTVCVLIGPNRLSEITNVIQKGLTVNLTLNNEEMKVFKAGEKVVKTLSVDLTEEQIKNLNLPESVLKDAKNNELTLDFELKLNKNNAESANDFEKDDVLSVGLNVKFAEKLLVEDNKSILFEEFYKAERGFLDFSQIGGIDLTKFGGAGICFENDKLELMLNTKTKINIDRIVKICVMLLVLYLIAYITNYIEDFIMAVVNNRVSKDLRSKVLNKINKLPLSYFDKVQYGDVLSRMINDVDTIGNTLNNSFTELIAASAQFIGALIMMFATNWIMALSGVLSTLIGFAFMFLIIKKSQRYFVEQQKVLGLVNGTVEESYSGQDVIKAYNAEAQTVKSFDKQNEKLYQTSWRAQFYSGIMFPLMGFIGNLGYVVVCVVGAVLVHFGYINFAVIVAIMIYIRLFTQPLSELGQAGAQLQTTAAASHRVFELLEGEELSSQDHITKQLTDIKGDVEFKNVKFGYNPRKIIIKDFSVKVKAGQKVAIVGPTGAGKTTLVNLLMKFYDLNGGEIYIDGIPISELSRENVHNIFGMVLQDTWLFQGSVKENLRFNRFDISDEEIVKACKACGIDHFVKTLPNGYDTVLDDNTTISAGQKQLLTIARAMVENAPMLILDEATSSVDTRTEVLIQKAMDALTKNRTSFVIAHRLSTIKNADLILVMKDGDVVEIGNHKTLIKQNGLYAELYNSQFEN